MSLLATLVISQSLHAAVIKHDVSSPTYKEFDYKEVCETFKVKDAVLVSPSSLTEMECFNKKFQLMEFCLSKFPMEKTLTRGYVDKDKKKVICEMSESVMISVSCDERDLKYCFDPKRGCEELKKIYGNRLDIAHFSMLEKNLNCYFAKPIGETLNEN
jgi:hypothetical protein